MRNKQVMTAHLLAAVASDRQHAEAMGLVGGNLDDLAREVRTFLDQRAPKFSHAALPEQTRGLVKATRRIIAGETFPAVLAADTRYCYLVQILRKTGFAACLPAPSYSIKQHAALLTGLSATGN